MASLTQTSKGGWRVQVSVLGIRDSASFRTKREAEAWGGAMEYKIREAVKNKRELIAKLGGSIKSANLPDIVGNQVLVPNVPGVYILFLDGAVSYVGKSNNMLTRIARHSENGRKFTHYHAIPCHPEDLDDREKFYISLLIPAENRAIPQ